MSASTGNGWTPLERRIVAAHMAGGMVTVRSDWTRIITRSRRGVWRSRYYWRRLRMPWIAWAMFS